MSAGTVNLYTMMDTWYICDNVTVFMNCNTFYHTTADSVKPSANHANQSDDVVITLPTE